MAESFKERGKGEEQKFNLNQELQFKANSRRNKLLGLWLSEKHFGLQGKAAEEYANDLVVLALDAPGIENMIIKISSDMEKHSCSLSEDALREKIAELQLIAEDEIQKET